jgi:hypothetical protein
MPDESNDIVSLRYADVGTALPAVGSAPVTWPSSPGAAANEKQSVTIGGAPTGGTFTLSFGGETTAGIPHDAIASEVEGALEALSSIGEGNVNVSGSAGGPWTVEFIRDLGNQDVATMTKNAGGLTGGSNPTVTVAVVTPGSTGGGIWTVVPTVDAEKTTKLTFDGETRTIRTAGTARPVRGYVLASALAGIEFTPTESGLAVIRFMFPSFPWDGDKVALRARSVEATYKAIALETPLGVWHAVKCAPKHSGDFSMTIKDLTQPTVSLETYELSGVVANFWPFI